MSEPIIEAGTITALEGECTCCGEEELAEFDCNAIDETGVITFDHFAGCLYCEQLEQVGR